ncbi:DUF3107 domain-containing protein [Pseudoclavibacter caeni]|jgi:hypothetical protein|uniref:DUF3107 domain-containing protein n=1 Tax=Pseudoclavibacter caeni TaxID=908846 RepID=A0A7C8FX37_9MICO|nr:DUF3107 domain-containing protein [Pseudoclavibacter caeni]KAB1632001.1 DUF3107 domain-containing protein [Pseudoclavibacter caeni]NYJ96786.1 hypothetical protein [Pseudoclavibacter caeni]
MEVRIGVRHSARELSFESSQKPEEVTEAVARALAEDDGVLRLSDEKGRLYLIPAEGIAYVEVGPQETRRIGFVS